MNSKIIMYQTEDGLTKIETNFDGDTVWLSIVQMAELFQRDKSTISRHIKNIFTEGELERDSVVANLQQLQLIGIDKMAICKNLGARNVHLTGFLSENILKTD